MKSRLLLPMIAWLALIGAAHGQQPTSAAPTAPAPLPPQIDTSAPPATETVDSSMMSPERGYRWAGEVDGLYWWFQGAHLPPLVTTSRAGTPYDSAGVLGLPGTSILAGENRKYEGYAGGRLRLAYFLDDLQTDGVEATFLGVGGDNPIFKQTSTGIPILARPFFNVTTGVQDSQLVAFPGSTTGLMEVASRDQLYGAEINLKSNLRYGDTFRVHLLYGVRYLQFEEDLDLKEQTTSVAAGGGVPLGTVTNVTESFNADNYIAAGQIGAEAEVRRGIFSFVMRAKLGLGANFEHIQVRGNTIVTVPGMNPVMQPTGLLTDAVNIGNFQKQQSLAVLPEIGMLFVFRVTPRLTANVGYNFLYILGAVRPSDVLAVPQVDPTLLSPTNNTAPQRPSRSFSDSDVWIQGITGGLEFKF